MYGSGRACTLPAVIDTHCHLTFPEYAGRVADLLSAAREAGVSGAITISTTTQDATRTVALAREHEALVERAFAMGEQSLVALLRSAALREDAQAETERAEIGVGLMRSRLAQVSGVMP